MTEAQQSEPTSTAEDVGRPSELAPRGLRVLTLNVWARSGAWDDRRRVLVDGLRRLQPDLVALQESVIVDGYDQVVDLLGTELHVVHQQARAGDGMGVSIASRWPIESVRELDLHLTPRTDEFPCTSLAAEIAVPGPVGRVLFVNHFPSWQLGFEHERQVQAVAAARMIDQLIAGREMHVVLAGDLDADPAAGSIRFWTGREALDGLSVCYRDAWESIHPDEPGQTYNAAQSPDRAARDWPFGRIDYVLVRCDRKGPTLAIRDSRRVFDEPIGGVWPSDHFGVMADLAPRDGSGSPEI